MKNLINIIGLVLLGFAAIAQVPKPADPQTEPIILMNGIAHLGNGEVIENSAIAFENGKITLVADARTIRLDLSKYKVIDIAEQHVYPGLILPNTTLGLEEIAAVRATRDHTEVGNITPNVRSLIAYNTDSELIATLRYNGILLAQPTPNGGAIPGTSAIMMLDGWNWEDAAYVEEDGVHIDWPAKNYGARWWLGESSGRPNENYNDEVKAIVNFMHDAKAYSKVSAPEVVNLKMEAMKAVFSGEKKLYLHADARAEIVESVQMAKEFDLDNIAVVGAEDAFYALDFLKANKVSVLLDMVHRRPTREDEDIDLPYRLPGILHEAGILTGLTYPRLQNSRNLPFFAGTAAAYGMDKEEALKLVTSNPAKILGIDDRAGTIEEGKDAHIIVSRGDLLDMKDSQLSHAFIMGKQIILDGKQQLLYERFKEKYSDKE